MANRLSAWITLLGIAASSAWADDRTEFTARYREAEALWAQGKLKDALPPYAQAAALVAKVFGENHRDTGNIYNNYGQLLSEAGRFDEADKWLKRGLALREKIAPDSLDVAVSLNNLGELRRQSGRHKEAVPLFERSLKLKQTNLPHSPNPAGTRVSIAFTLNNLGICLRESGAYGESEVKFQSALALFEKDLKPGDPRIYLCKDNYAQTLLELGRYRRAQDLLEECLPAFRRGLPAGHPDIAVCASNLGLVYRNLHQVAKALPLYEECLAIQEKTLPADHPNLAQTHNNLGVAYQDLKRYDDARRHLERALEIRRRLQTDNPCLAMSLNDLAFLELVVGNLDRSQTLFEEALAADLAAFGSLHLNSAVTFHNYADLQSARGKLPAAVRAFTDGRKAVREHIGRVLPGLSDEEQLEFLLFRDRALLLSALQFGVSQGKDPAVAAAAAEWLLNGKGIAAESLARTARLQASAESDQARAKLARLRDTRRDLARRIFSAPKADRFDRAETERLLNLERELFKELARETPRGEVDGWTELAAVRKQLRADETLLEFVRLQATPPRYAVWRISADQDPIVADLGSAEEIDRLIEKFRRKIGSEQSRAATPDAPASQVDSTIVLRALGEKLLAPIVSGEKPPEKLLLSPDGPLWLVPWCAVFLDGEPLIKRTEIRLLNSGRDLVSPAAPRRELRPPVIFADPDFDLAPAQVAAATKEVLRDGARSTEKSAHESVPLSKPVLRLPGTAAEAAAVLPNLKRLAAVEPKQYTERFATEGVLKAVRSPRIALLSTHGFFLDESLEIRHPLLRSGLLLAGANTRRSAVHAEDDGIVTALELSSVDFRGTELVVLSACETGVGKIQVGDGVAGLCQALRSAGAEKVIGSLWQVPDRESALLMSKFFEQLADGDHPATALRRALNLLELTPWRIAWETPRRTIGRLGSWSGRGSEFLQQVFRLVVGRFPRDNVTAASGRASLFGRRTTKKTATAPGPPIELDGLIAAFGQAAADWESRPRSAEFIRARLGDACRDAQVRPVGEKLFLETWRPWDEEHQRRFCILLAGLEQPAAQVRCEQLCGRHGPAESVLQHLQQLTERLPALTGSVLQQSDVRLEEFARHFCADWNLPIDGETAEDSASRLHDIDFGRLMREADAARASAEDRLAYLRQLQEEQEKTRRPRRGKW